MTIKVSTPDENFNVEASNLDTSPGGHLVLTDDQSQTVALFAGGQWIGAIRHA